MVRVIFDPRFKELFSKIRDNSLKIKIIKQIEKLGKNPETDKPMRNVRKGTHELYVRPFRLSYEYLKSKELVYILDLYHKDKQ